MKYLLSFLFITSTCFGMHDARRASTMTPAQPQGFDEVAIVRLSPDPQDPNACCTILASLCCKLPGAIVTWPVAWLDDFVTSDFLKRVAQKLKAE